jgi:hypothetical protein
MEFHANRRGWVFGNPCAFVGDLDVEKATGLIRERRTIQACLRSPGHCLVY